MFKHPFSFKGRIRRTEYLLTHLIYTGFMTLCDYLGQLVENEWIRFFMTVLAFIPAFWFLIAQTAKRCHDRDMSGWAQLVAPYQLILFFADGQPGENEYGKNPRS